MSYDEFLTALSGRLPHLAGQLEVEKVIFKKEENKIYICFLAGQLVRQKDFLTIEREARRLFPMANVSVRVASPALASDFLSGIDRYRGVLEDFLKRAYPASVSWLNDIDWLCNGERITLTFPDSFSLDFLSRGGMREKLQQAIWDIFRVRPPVEMRVRGDQEARIARLIEQRKEDVFVASDAPRHEESQPVKPQPPKAICGRSIGEKPVPIRELTADAGTVVIEGDIIKQEVKELKGGERVLLTVAVTDYTSTILCKLFLRYHNDFRRKDEEPQPVTDEERARVQEKLDRVKEGMRVKIKGECQFDNFSHELAITIRDMMPVEKHERMDTAPEKRIELHMHTQMSLMDALAPVESLIARAAKWGHPAVAVTDHGVVQAFPEAFAAAKKNNIKLLPGCEGYLTDDAAIVRDGDERPLNAPVVVLDFETTGLNTHTDRIIEIGAVKLENGQITDAFSALVNPEMGLPARVTEVTHINDAMLRDQPVAAEVLPGLMEFLDGCAVAAHNASFDISVLRNELARLGRAFSAPVIDTLAFSRKLYPQLKTHKLKSVCKHLGVSLKDAHRAVNDAAATAMCLAEMFKAAEEKGCLSLAEIDGKIQGGAIGDSYHIVLLAKNTTGMVNLNKIISEAHLYHFRRRPHMPRNVLDKYREGLIFGSACEAGELFRAVLDGESDEKLMQIASYYDYLEIQPIGNNAFLIREGRVPDEDALRQLNVKIVELAEKLGKPYVATGDVHFLEPHDQICRAILQAGMGYEDCDKQPPLYLKTTDEMLEEFAYLGEERCRKAVIENPRLIADMVENISLFPKHPNGGDTFQPLWPDAEDNIRNMCWGRAKEWYGEDLPEIVTKRLEKELGAILGYGFATLYNIAQKMVLKSNEDGYLVGSRGSVGSSFAATMCGITEVNPLPPHYRCAHCHKGFFDVDPSMGTVGVDLPDKDCPICGKPLIKDGFDIPFEVFLGFKGDKVPDIDLNFASVYQSRAQAYVEELFGKGHVFRAGTIGGLADKTAYGYVAKYMEERGIQCGNAEKDRLTQTLVGVKRTTGQHPAGMIVLPKEYEIYQFTAINRPADDVDSNTITTHYAFKSMHDILVKLDCLGHDDPTMIYYLEQLTGIPYTMVPLDDPEVRSLFSGPEALGVTKEDINCTTGTFGVPEFGTAFVRGMLDDTHPSTMEELVRISGLSHGTDVWLGNAKDLIESGTATLRECICCRDDIMNYLIKMGVKDKISFDTMESVRKGKGLKPEMESAMIEANVPKWFIESCEKIKYMFPKGHAVAYVTNALRIAWFKVHCPLAYYAAYFTVRGDGFDGSEMILEPDAAKEKIKELRANDKRTPADDEKITALELVLEMGMRGMRFLPVDLYKSKAKEFVIEDGGLRVPFSSLSGLGESAAEQIVAGRDSGGEFISVEDFRLRTHAGSSVIEALRAQGALAGIPESSQVSFF